MFVCFLGQVSTSGVAEEGEAPDAGGAADEQAHGQHGSVLHLPAQPADEEEAQDDLHPAQAVHQAVGQLAKTKVALRHRRHHGLGMFERDESGTEVEILIRAESSFFLIILSPSRASFNPDQKSCSVLILE